MRYRTILADPPWRFKNWGMDEQAKRGEAWARRNGRSPYDCMDTSDICKLPVVDVAERDCTLLLWATNPKLEDAFEVIRAWGFTYRTMLTWVKMHRAAAPRIGLGYHARSATEHLLVAARGDAPAPDVACRPCSALFHPIGAHSAKPDLQYEIAEGYPGPYLEMFHRPRSGGLIDMSRPDWTYTGNEVTGRDIVLDLRDLAADVPLPQLGQSPTPPAQWLTPSEQRPDLFPGTRCRFLGQDGAHLEGEVQRINGRLDIQADRMNGKPLRVPIPYTFGAELPAGLERA